MAARRTGTSPWLYLGCGCAALAGLCVVAVVAAGFFGVSLFKGFVEDMKDPAARTARAREILGTAQLPDGYHAQMFFRIPWILDLVVLSDGPAEELAGEALDDFDPLDSEHVGEHVFLYIAVRGGDEEDFEEIFERGRSGQTQIDLGARFDPGETLGAGTIDLASQEIRYTAILGELVTEDRERIDGVYSQMRVRCPRSGKLRVALWFERAPEDLGEGEAPELAGTPADESALREFMSHFDLCGG